MKYVDLIIDNNTDRTDRFYTYACRDDSVQVGRKVYVPFNRGNIRKAAYVFQVKDSLQKPISGLKEVESLDETLCLTEEMVETCIWMKSRYLCRYIEAINCFVPVGAALKSGKSRVFVAEKVDLIEPPVLTHEQEKALSRILPYINEHKHGRFLVHGVTGSGKTELYMQLMEACLSSGKTAIMLVPEISLTRQIIDRFQGRFGAETLAVIHSKISKGERFETWQRISRGEVSIVIGARSAVFAPLKDIGLIILDEEHESTYKSDMSPKYDAVEVALKRVMGQEPKGVLVLGSATPSVATYRRGEEGIYEIIELKERYNKVALPFVEVVDMRKELKEGNSSIFSRALYKGLADCFDSGKQGILFLNRRGYASFVSCRSCGYVMKCPDCGISLTYHKEANRVICHYCGYREPLKTSCPDCGGAYIKQFGVGTEQVEEAVKNLFPEVSVARLDLDTIKRKGTLDRILGDFRRGKQQLLVGTQLVAKGLDFENVSLVGVVSADVSLNIPDFRSPERAFQLITQAAGRAGRGELQGKVVVQTYAPDHYAIRAAARQDYGAFYSREILFRDNMDYPPFTDLMLISFTAEEEKDAMKTAAWAEQKLAETLGPEERKNIFPPYAAPIFRSKAGYRVHLLLKCPKKQRKLYLDRIDGVKRALSSGKNKTCLMTIDINPYSFI